MYLPRSLISKLYIHLQQTRHPLSPPVLILVALEPDALCACRILARLLKHDYIPHKIQPVSGRDDLEKAGKELVTPLKESEGGSGGVVVCLGVGGMVSLGEELGLDGPDDDAPYSGVEVWLMDARRPWNLENVFGSLPWDPATEISSTNQSRSPAGVDGGKITRAFNPGRGGIIVFDDGDIEEDMEPQRNAYLTIADLPEFDDGGEDLGDTDDEEGDDDDENVDDIGQGPTHAGQKRKSWSDAEDDSDDDRPRQRRRSNSVRLPGHFSLDFINIPLSLVRLQSRRDVHNRGASSPHSKLICLAIQPSPPLEHNHLQARHLVHCADGYDEFMTRTKPSASSITIWEAPSRNRYLR